MNKNSNVYTIIYASVLVIIVAFILAFVSSSLKELQTKNVELDKKKQILSALNIKEVKDAEAEYDKYVKEDQIIDTLGNVISSTGGFDVKDINVSQLPLYVCSVNGETKYVIPVDGAGLWGPIWGYVAINADKNTVYGTYFSHASETPGLGAEIAKTDFQDRFIGKKVKKDGVVNLSVVKNGKVESSMSDYQVDGISGGTITSKGVDAMIRECLSDYSIFLNK